MFYVHAPITLSLIWYLPRLQERLVTTLGCKQQIWHSRKVNQLAAKAKDSLSSRDWGHNDFDGNRWHNLQQNCETRNDFCGRLVCLCQWSCPKAENKGWLRPICAGAEPTWYHPRRVNPGKYHQWEISAAYRVFFYAGWILLDGLKSCAKKHLAKYNELKGRENKLLGTIKQSEDRNQWEDNNIVFN